MAVKKVGILTAGGLAPCLSSTIGFLIERYTQVAPDVEIIGYINGYINDDINDCSNNDRAHSC